MQSNDDKRTESSAVPAAVDVEIDGTQPGTADPGIAQVRSYLIYGLSLPERALRSTTAVVGGAVGGSMKLLLPQAFRSSRSYSIFVQQMLDFMVRDMGGVEVPTEDDEQQDPEVESFVARKTVGTFVEMAGWATLHLSPVTVLAIFSDLAYGSKTYLNELSSELKAKGLIDEETTIDQVSDLLDALSKTSGMTAEAFDMPPISVEGLKETVAETKKAISQTSPTQLIPQSELQRLWVEMKETAKQQDALQYTQGLGSQAWLALADALAANGQFDEATQSAQKAEQQARSVGEVEMIRERIAFYREKRPFIQQVERNVRQPGNPNFQPPANQPTPQQGSGNPNLPGNPPNNNTNPTNPVNP